MLAEVAKLPSEDLQALLRKISQCRPDDVRAALGAAASDASTADASGSETSGELDLPIPPNSAGKSSPWSPLPTLLGSRSLRFGGKAIKQYNEDIMAPLW